MAQTQRSSQALDWLYFFVADLQTGFGPFIVVYLTTMAWTDADIGFALSLGTMAALLSQIPAGAMVDAARDKRTFARAALLAIALSAVLLASFPTPLPVLLSRVLHGFASCILNTSLAALSLALVGPRLLGERLGRNARYGSLGSALAAGIMGWIGSTLSPVAVFWLTALLALPSLLCLYLLDPDDLKSGPQPTRRSAAQPSGRAADPTPGSAARLWFAVIQRDSADRWQSLLANRGVLVFIAFAALFTLSNAAMLPLVSAAITRHSGDEAAAIIAACLVLPQLVAVALSPWMGKLAEQKGRRILLVALAALPLRGILLADVEEPFFVIFVQALDGISGAAFNILLPLLASDLTRGTNQFNVCMGVFSLAVSIGAIISTSLGGTLAAWAGLPTTLLVLAAIGALGLLLVWIGLPETKPQDSEAWSGS